MAAALLPLGRLLQRKPPQLRGAWTRSPPFSSSCRAGLSDSGGGSGDGGEKREKDGKAEKKGLRPLEGFYAEAAKMGRGLRENLSPKQKGDWKDVLLMSLSFAVYVYISQKLVCAYCAWKSML